MAIVKMKKFILPLIFIFLIGTFVFAKMLSSNVNKETEAEKDLLESIQLVDMNGNDYTFSRGKNIYIKFWASWCPTCLAGLPEVDSLAANHSDDTVVLSVVAPGVNREKKAEDFKEWFSGLDYKNLPVLMAETPDFFKQVGVIGYPTSVFINANGELVQAHPGHLSNEDIQKQLDKL